MVIKTYGEIFYMEASNKWCITKAEPHIMIKLKSIFERVGKTQVVPIYMESTPEICHDLIWFMERYPLSISDGDINIMLDGSNSYKQNVNHLESIFAPEYVPHKLSFKDGKAPREYQLRSNDFHKAVSGYLLGDDIGLGKTVSAICTLMEPTNLPAVIVVPSHLTSHWEEKIKEFTNLSIHVIQKTKPYNLPPADVYIGKYSFLGGWVDVIKTGIFKSTIFEEIHELRHPNTQKYRGAKVLRDNTRKLMGLSATPIYNYGNEIYWVMNIIRHEALGRPEEFYREWCPDGFMVKDPKALGSYLRERHLLLRRTREEVGRELPMINKVVYTVGYDEKSVMGIEERAVQLALKTREGTFFERGQAARELDIYLRQKTGVSKARDVAAFVKILLDGGETIVLAGWHREVYEIWLEELKEYNPVFYTGKESISQKNKSKKAFTTGDTKLFVISLRSGVGLDGLQHVCNNVVYGELDYSPKVHDQLTGRVQRDGQKEIVNAYFLVSDFGSDPVIMDILGLKSSQSHGIVNPYDEFMESNTSDESRAQKMANLFLDKNKDKFGN